MEVLHEHTDPPVATVDTTATDHIVAMVTAKAWNDADYLQRLADDPREVLAEEGYTFEPDIEMRVLVDKPGLTHVAVTRQTTDPEPVTALIKERFPLPADEEIRIVQSTESVRYLVVPMKPVGLDAEVEAELALLGKQPTNSNDVWADAEAIVTGWVVAHGVVAAEIVAAAVIVIVAT